MRRCGMSGMLDRNFTWQDAAVMLLLLILIGCVTYRIAHDGKDVKGGAEQVVQIVVKDAETGEVIQLVPVEHERGQPFEIEILLKPGAYFAVAIDGAGNVSEPSEVTE